MSNLFRVAYRPTDIPGQLPVAHTHILLMAVRKLTHKIVTLLGP